MRHATADASSNQHTKSQDCGSSKSDGRSWLHNRGSAHCATPQEIHINTSGAAGLSTAHKAQQQAVPPRECARPCMTSCPLAFEYLGAMVSYHKHSGLTLSARPACENTWTVSLIPGLRISCHTWAKPCGWQVQRTRESSPLSPPPLSKLADFVFRLADRLCWTIMMMHACMHAWRPDLR